MQKNGMTARSSFAREPQQPMRRRHILGGVVTSLIGSAITLGVIHGALPGFRTLIPMRLRVWRSVILGKYRHQEEYFQQLVSQNFEIAPWAYPMLDATFPLNAQLVSVDLVAISVLDLGFDRPVSYGNLLRRASAMGLQKCPAEVGPALRLAYPDQPTGERLIIAMDGIEIGPESDLPLLFAVTNEVGEYRLALDGDPGGYDRRRFPEEEFVFVLPRVSN